MAAGGRVWAVEVSPLVLRMATANALLRFPGVRPVLLLEDFLMTQPDVAAMVREPGPQYEVGVTQPMLPGLQGTADHERRIGFDAIICNPPYTRHHALPEAYKDTWFAQAEREFGIHFSRFSSLFAYFFVHAARFLKPGGRMAFITPAVVFEAAYSQHIKRFIRDQLHLRAIVSFAENVQVFEGVDTAACITLVEGPASSRTPAKAVHINRWPGSEAVLEAVQAADTTYPWGTVKTIDSENLKPREKWTVMTRQNGLFGGKKTTTLGQMARTMRGIATGANSFFVLSDAEVEEWGIDWVNVRPVLTKTREATNYRFTQADFNRLGQQRKKRWLLALSAPVDQWSDGPEARYIRYGETLGLHKRSLVRTRARWYEMERRQPAPIYFTYLSRSRSRFIHNQAGVLALNVFICVYPMPQIAQDDTSLKALLAVLNAPLTKDALRGVGRSYGADTVKLEPRELDRLPVLDILALDIATRRTLASLFDELCATTSEGDRDLVRRDIDAVVVSAMK